VTRLGGAVTRRRLALAGVAVALLAAAVAILRGGDDRFLLKAEFDNASGLRKDFFVKIGGVPVGKVEDVTLDERDVAVVSMRIDRSALPIGRDAKATIRPSSLLGEHHVELERGDVEEAASSGSLIRLARTSTATELDQVLAAFDEPTRTALAVFLTESGNALVGRGQDLAATLRMMPPTLEQASTVLRDLSHDNAALGRLVRDSDRVVAPLARERTSLGRLVGTADRALKPLAEGRDYLGESIAGGPDAIVELRRTLRRVRSLSRGLVPAADGLRASAAPLETTLATLPGFARAAGPSLRELRRTAPPLSKLARLAEPTVTSLVPVTSRLVETARAFEPTSQMLDRRVPDMLAFFEGYARAMHRSDKLGHIYNTQTVFENLSESVELMRSGERSRPRRVRPERDSEARPSPEAAPERQDGTESPREHAPEGPKAPKLPKVPTLPQLPGLEPGEPKPEEPRPGQLEDLLDSLLKP
jgi:phospholipid/cholesterol/gamma-HCH transport system substrate-binding protein